MGNVPVRDGGGYRPEDEDTEAERELGVLLERAVPQMPAPADRMSQIRRRVQRRRKRRLAAATAGTAAVVGAALLTLGGVFVPGAGDPHREASVPPAAAPTVPSPEASGSGGPSPTRAADGATTVHLKDMYGLTLRLPRGWTGFTGLDPDAMMIGFLSPQPMHTYKSCDAAADTGYSACPPVTELRKDSALIYVHKTMTTKTDGEAGFDGTVEMKAGKGCRILKGDVELQTFGGIPTKKDRPLMLRVDVCLREPTENTMAVITKALATAEFR
ncbi:hypothetical protein [Streptomyces sp. NPDC026673]|uniref:hypothetical protein n=1 Tax=Streptomyces sp. NPDC026673 TaxID=3155724 RepID=UPI0033FA8E3A